MTFGYWGGGVCVRSDRQGLWYDLSLFEQLLKVVFNWWVDGH